MNVLVSAYACNPARGGEEGIGFNWMHEWHHTGHAVWCLTTPAGRPALDAYVDHLGPDDQTRMHIEYVQVPKVIDYLYRWQFGVYLHYIVWQFLAWRMARRLNQQVNFDLVHLKATYPTGLKPKLYAMPLPGCSPHLTPTSVNHYSMQH
jgi:hypothetical protein